MDVYNLITIIRNASIANTQNITVTASKKLLPFLEVLYQEKYIAGFKKITSRKIEISFILITKKNKFLSLKLLSRPSRYIYFSLQDLWKFQHTLYLVILSTPFGVITHNSALKRSCGGKVLCILA